MSWTEARDGGSLETKLSQADIKFVGEIARVEYRPGDFLVLFTEEQMTRETALRLQDNVREAFGPSVKVLVLDSGLKMGVIGGLDASARV